MPFLGVFCNRYTNAGFSKRFSSILFLYRWNHWGCLSNHFVCKPSINHRRTFYHGFDYNPIRPISYSSADGRTYLHYIIAYYIYGRKSIRSVIFLKISSLLISIAEIFVIYYFLKDLTKNMQIAYIGTTLTLINPNVIFLCSLLRMYGLFLLLSTFSFWMFASIIGTMVETRAFANPARPVILLAKKS